MKSQAAWLVGWHSQSVTARLKQLSQATVRSTTHRLATGSTPRVATGGRLATCCGQPEACPCSAKRPC
jgi:hypothetical protein